MEIISLPKRETNRPIMVEFQDLRKRANAGDQEALAELRTILDENETIWRYLSDLAAHCQQSLLRSLSSGDVLISESVLRRLQEIRQELLGPSPTLLEELAVERVITAWLEVEYLENTYPVTSGENATQIRKVNQLKDSAERRYQLALRSMATLRKLLRQPGKPGRPPKG